MAIRAKADCRVGGEGVRSARLGHDALLGAELRGDGLQVAEVLVVRELAGAEPAEGRVGEGDADLARRTSLR